MDSLGLSREQLEGLLHDEVESLQRQAIEAEDPKGFVQSVMQPCLVALDASGI